MSDDLDYKALYEAIFPEYQKLKDNEAVLLENGMRLEWRDPKKLKKFGSNNKRHGQKDLAGLHASVKEFGFKDVILIEPDDTIIAGHGRDIIAEQIDKPRVPVLVCFDLSKAKARAYRIAHNRTAQLSKFSDANLRSELLELKTLEDYNLEPLTPLQLDKWLPQDIPEFDLGDEFPKPKHPSNAIYTDSGMGLADTLFPGEPEFGIPILLSELQAKEVPAKMVKWGEVAAKEIVDGWHFYAYDNKLYNLWHNPDQLLKSSARFFVEVNFSIRKAHSRAYALGQIYRKRQIARWLQSKGKMIFVDLNVGSTHVKDNFLGVPSNWKAFAVRGSVKKLPYIVDLFEAACRHCNSEEILGLVYGGGGEVKDLCQEIEAVYISERQTEVRESREVKKW